MHYAVKAPLAAKGAQEFAAGIRQPASSHSSSQNPLPVHHLPTKGDAHLLWNRCLNVEVQEAVLPGATLLEHVWIMQGR